MMELLVGIPVVIIGAILIAFVIEYGEFFLGLIVLSFWGFVAFNIGEYILS